MWLRGKQSQIYSVNNTECLKCARYILSVDHTEINQKSLRAYILANYFITVLLLVFGYKERIKIIRQSVALKKKMWVLFWRTSHYQYFSWKGKYSFRPLPLGWQISKPFRDTVSKAKANSHPLFHLTCCFIFYFTLKFWVDWRFKEILFAIYENDLKF